jgi:YesN/AraC family two-component response regulator
LNRLGQLEILQKLLEASGHEIVGTAYNGLEATQLIQAELSENRRGG